MVIHMYDLVVERTGCHESSAIVSAEPRPKSTERSVARSVRWSVAAAALAMLTGALLAFGPIKTTTSEMRTSVSTGSRASDSKVTTVGRSSLIETEGRGLLVVLLIPVVIAIGPAAGRKYGRHRGVAVASAAMMAALVIVGLLSIGVFYIPTLVLTIIAAWWSP